MNVLEQTGRRGLLLRVLPAAMYAGRASALVERSILVYSRIWLMFLSGALEPVLYLLAFQYGFGKLVTEVTGPGGQTMSYVAFVAPALMASAAMNGAVFDSTYNMFFKLRHSKLYDAVLSTPMGPFDVAIGEISWAVVRGGIYALGFLGVMAAMGLVHSPWALLLVPVALLISFAFASIGMAGASFLRSTSQFDYIQLVLMPLFLFSTTFYPLSVYPDALQAVVRCFPLYHGVELMRSLSVGVLEPSMLGNLAYLLVMAGLGIWATSKRLGHLLLK
ncbi:ABC transporter permease [Amycolatopsis sp. NPDC059657]|uniref:ABC transporter permease n=1 Tax=Amycolatopsis sp. NPDC059657 TaxID=3346899 RepID=UPI00366D399C